MRCLGLPLLLMCASNAFAQPLAEYDPTKLPQQITHLDLTELDLYRAQLYDLRYNVFQHEQAKTTYADAIVRLEGKQLTWPVIVKRVTAQEVVLRHAQYGRTRVILTYFDEDGNVIPGNMRFHYYCGAPSNRRYAVHATQPALRIGVEISEEFARKLQKDDVFFLQGRIEGIDTRYQTKNGPDTLLFVGDMRPIKEEVAKKNSIY